MDLWYFDSTEIENTTELVYEFLIEDGVQIQKAELFEEMYCLAINQEQFKEWEEIKSITCEIAEHSSRVQTPVENVHKQMNPFSCHHTENASEKCACTIITRTKSGYKEVSDEMNYTLLSTGYLIILARSKTLMSLATNRLAFWKHKLYKECYHITTLLLFFFKKKFVAMVVVSDARSVTSATTTKELKTVHHEEELRNSLLSQKMVDIMYDQTIFERIKKNNIYNIKRSLVAESFKKEKEHFDMEVSLRSTRTFFHYSALPFQVEKRKKTLFEKFSTNRSKSILSQYIESVQENPKSAFYKNKPRNRSESVTDILKQTTSLLSNQQNEEALSKLLSAQTLPSFTLTPSFCMQLGEAYHNLGEYQTAIESFSNCIARDPMNSIAYFAKAECYLALELYEECERELEKFLKLEPESADAMQLLAKCKATLGKRAEAIEILSYLIDGILKDDAYVYFLRGKLYDESEQMNLATIDFNMVKQLDPGFISKYEQEAIECLVLFYFYNDYTNLFVVESKNDWISALETYSSLHKLNPFELNYLKKCTDLNHMIAKEMIDDEKRVEYLQQAVLMISKLIELVPTDYISILYRGQLLLDLQSDSDAIIDFSTCIEGDPSMITPLKLRAMLFAKADNKESAKEDYEKLVQVDPTNNPEAYLFLTDLYFNMEQYEQCLYYFIQGIRHKVLSVYGKNSDAQIRGKMALAICSSFVQVQTKLHEEKLNEIGPVKSLVQLTLEKFYTSNKDKYLTVTENETTEEISHEDSLNAQLCKVFDSFFNTFINPPAQPPPTPDKTKKK